MGDRLGTQGAVGILFFIADLIFADLIFFFKLVKFSSDDSLVETIPFFSLKAKRFNHISSFARVGSTAEAAYICASGGK